MNSMKLLNFRGRHTRWADLVGAYVDRELPTAERGRFEEHLQACASCRSAVEEQRALRGLLAASLRPVEAPRSFALTSELLEARGIRQRAPARSPGFFVGAAQAGAALAFVALVSLVVFDATGDSAPGAGNDAALERSSKSSAPLSAATPAAGESSAAAAGDRQAQPDATQASDSPPAEQSLATEDAMGSGAGAEGPAFTPGDAAGSAPGNVAGGAAAGDQLFDDPGIESPPPSSDNGGANALRVAEVVLAAVVLGALAASFAVKRTRRS
jgi:hypothetical protein